MKQKRKKRNERRKKKQNKIEQFSKKELFDNNIKILFSTLKKNKKK